ncbi:hypothetical protein D3C71_23030 [compost metagenome]
MNWFKNSNRQAEVTATDAGQVLPGAQEPQDPVLHEELPQGAEVADSVAQSTTGDATAPESQAPAASGRKGFFSRRPKTQAEGQPDAAAPRTRLFGRGQDRRKFQTVPVRVLIGFLPDVRERDARDYALGAAEKNFNQPALAFYDAFEYDGGYAYEVHEGGEGGALLPSILRYFRSQGPFVPGEDVKVVIRTGTRMVEVQRDRVGLSAILLPESSTVEPTDWLVPTEKLTPALNQRTGLLAVGAAFFITGFFALIVGSMLTRYQPYEDAPKPGVSTISYEDLPISQWPRLTNLAPDSYVTKLVYENGKWQRPEIRNVGAQPAPVAVASDAAASAPTPMPNMPPQMPGMAAPAPSVPSAAPADNQ